MITRNIRSDTIHPSSYLTHKQWCIIVKKHGLSERQSQIIKYIFDGLDELAISGLLEISADTVHSHVMRLYRILGVHNRAGLVTKLFITYITTCASQ